MSNTKIIETEDARFLVFNDNIFSVKCRHCGKYFYIEFEKPMFDLLKDVVYCPECRESLSLPQEIQDLMKKAAFSTDKNGKHSTVCVYCHHKFQFELDDVMTHWVSDRLKCPNCKSWIEIWPPYSNPKVYTQLNEWEDLMRYLRLTKEIDREMLLEHFNRLNQKDFILSVRSLLERVEKDNFKQAFLIVLQAFGVDVVATIYDEYNINLYEIYMKVYDKYLKSDITNHEEIVAAYWKKYGKKISRQRINNYFYAHNFGYTLEDIKGTLCYIKDAINEYGIDIMPRIIHEGGRLDDGAAIDESESTVYSQLCKQVIDAESKEIANLYIDFILWLNKQGFECPCHIIDAVRYGGDTEYMYNNRYDYSKELEVILNDPENAHDILHKKK